MFRQLAAVAAAAVTTVALLAAPAGAASPAPFQLTVPSVGVSTTGAYLPLVLSPTGPAGPQQLDNVQIAVDTTGVDGFATVTNPTPGLPQLTATGGWRLPQLFARATDEAALGTSGTVTVTVSADGYEPLTATATLTVNDVHVAGGPSATYTVADGVERAPVVFQFTNTGTELITEMTFRVVGDPGLAWDDRFGAGILCWDNTAAVQVTERFCDLTGLQVHPGTTWQMDYTTLYAPGAEPGDQFRLEATYWLGPGAKNVADALRKETGMKRGTRGLITPDMVTPAGPPADRPSQSVFVVVAP